ncbi:sucrase-isomaltase, intestinal-like [Lineus longissimus]|uniref:sucrase-isomaltase, intestinal-like n=1 Tax=Lineus longissimus TaxID=88925 RepID=UPI002B4E1C5A
METACEQRKGCQRGFLCFAVVILCIAGGTGIALFFILGGGAGSTTPAAPSVSARTAPLVDCSMGQELDEETCAKRSCVWRETPSPGEPNCVFSDTDGYNLDGDIEETNLGYRIKLHRINGPRVHGDFFQHLIVDVEVQTETRVRVKFSVFNQSRYEVPDEALHIPTNGIKANHTLYSVEFQKLPFFGIKIIRNATGVVIFDTTFPGFLFCDQFIQITTKLPSEYLYGLGEHNHRVFKHNMNWKTWSIFTRDVAPVDEWNLYGAHPFYMSLEKTNTSAPAAHGVFLKNSNAMDITLQPNPFPALTYRVIGGLLDFYIFLGPSPENVVQQLTEAVGRPMMPPYWSLGFQLSRWNYDNITHVEEVVERNRRAGIPQDVQYGDIDYMESKFDFTIDLDKYATLPSLVKDLHDHGQRYIIILDPAISNNRTLHVQELNDSYLCYEDGLKSGIYVKNESGDGFIEGEVWPGSTYFPDFTHPDTEAWWLKWCEDFYRNNSGRAIEYDALWIDMNEPANFVQGSTKGCAKNKLNYPPYVPKILGAGPEGRMYDKTLCMDSQQHWGLHYDVHSLYGHSQAIQTFSVLRTMFPTKRPLVLTRSSFTGTHRYAGHWLGDNQSQWPQMAWSIVGMLEFSLFGFSYIGADICGFWFDTSEEMCQRWMQLGAFYPFARNHNAIGFRDQDPAAFGDAMIKSSRDILLTRYKLLPYLYTLFHLSHTDGSTVARPVLHEFLDDENTWNIDHQFLWGPALLISPCLEEGSTTVQAYIPAGVWYDYFTGGRLLSGGEWKTFDTPLDTINLHVRGGYIIPWQKPANTTVYSRKNPMGLLVALDEHQKAGGELFWDDGESNDTFPNGQHLKLRCMATEAGQLNLVVESNTYSTDLVYDTIELWGLRKVPTSIQVDGKELSMGDIDVDHSRMALTLSNLNLDIKSNHDIRWNTF